jgi:hypothetical protein
MKVEVTHKNRDRHPIGGPYCGQLGMRGYGTVRRLSLSLFRAIWSVR